jgi:hypothetical protein
MRVSPPFGRQNRTVVIRQEEECFQDSERLRLRMLSSKNIVATKAHLVVEAGSQGVRSCGSALSHFDVSWLAHRIGKYHKAAPALLEWPTLDTFPHEVDGRKTRPYRFQDRLYASFLAGCVSTETLEYNLASNQCGTSNGRDEHV